MEGVLLKPQPVLRVQVDPEAVEMLLIREQQVQDVLILVEVVVEFTLLQVVMLVQVVQE